MYRIHMRINLQAFLGVFIVSTHKAGIVFLRAQRMTDHHAYDRKKKAHSQVLGAENLPQILGHVLDA